MFDVSQYLLKCSQVFQRQWRDRVWKREIEREREERRKKKEERKPLFSFTESDLNHSHCKSTNVHEIYYFPVSCIYWISTHTQKTVPFIQNIRRKKDANLNKCFSSQKKKIQKISPNFFWILILLFKINSLNSRLAKQTKLLKFFFFFFSFNLFMHKIS